MIALARYLLIGAFLLPATAAQAQPPWLQQGRTYSVFTPAGRAPNATATTATSRVALGFNGPVAWICNTGAVDGYVKFGNSTVVVVAGSGDPNSGTLVRAGSCMEMDAGGFTHMASITASSSTTLITSVGFGSPAAAGGGGSGGGGGGGAVTVADGADSSEGATTDATCAGDTTSGCTIQARLQRIAQRLTTILAGPLPVSQSGTWNITNISGTISLPTGASTAANQSSVIGTKNAGTAATNSQLSGGVFNSTPLTLSDMQQASLQVDANGFLKVNVATGGGSGGTSSNFGSAFPTPGTAIGLSDGTNMVAARSTASGADGVSNTVSGLQTYSRIQCFNGTTWDRCTQVTPGTAGTPGTQVLTVQGITSMTPFLTNPGTAANWGVGAFGSSVPANGVALGLRAQNAEATAVTNGQQVAMASDLAGKPIVLPFANPENFLDGNITSAMTGTSSTAVTGMGAQASGIRNYVTTCVASNSHATVGTMILLQDGSGGTTLAQLPAAPAFGGATVHFNPPIKTTAATGLFGQNVTTGANTFLTCTGYKGI